MARDALRLKVIVGDVTRRFTVRFDSSLFDFVRTMRSMFSNALYRISASHSGIFHLQYRDEEGDFIVLETENEWMEAKRVAARVPTGTLLIQVFSGSSDGGSSFSSLDCNEEDDVYRRQVLLNVDSEEEKSDPRDWIVVEHQLGASSLHEEFVTYTASLDSNDNPDLCMVSTPPVIYSAEPVCDFAVRDGDEIPQGTWFTKTFCLSNSSNISWPKGVFLSFSDGFCFEGSLHRHIVCPVELKPGDSTHFTIRMQAPSEPGEYTSFFRLFTPNGESFGPRLPLFIVVAPRLSCEDETILVDEMCRFSDEELQNCSPHLSSSYSPFPRGSSSLTTSSDPLSSVSPKITTTGTSLASSVETELGSVSNAESDRRYSLLRRLIGMGYNEGVARIALERSGWEFENALESLRRFRSRLASESKSIPSSPARQ